MAIPAGESQTFQVGVQAEPRSLISSHSRFQKSQAIGSVLPSDEVVTLAATTLPDVSRIFTTSFASVYPHYVTKVEKKGRTKADLDQVIGWLTGFDESELSGHLAAGTTFEGFFADARLNPNALSITGVVCGVRVEAIDDPLMQKIRYLDKLVDELAKGKPMDKILRG
jgi:hypothetical protein